jgi:hypothetical protein
MGETVMNENMLFTQIELLLGNEVEVWWVHEGNLKAHETISRDGVEWTINQVCTTLPLEAIPYGARIAHDFRRDTALMSFPIAA